MNNEQSFNEIRLSGIINNVFHCSNDKYIAFGLTCKKYSKNESNNQVFASLRIYKDLYNTYKDFFVKGKKIYVKGYINSYSDANKRICNFITVTEIFDNAIDLLNGKKVPHISYDYDGVMLWNGKRCEAIPPTEEERKEMENILSQYSSDK